MTINNDNLNFDGDLETFSAAVRRGDEAFAADWANSIPAEGDLQGREVVAIDIPPAAIPESNSQRLKRKKSVCELAFEMVPAVKGTLFSVAARCRNRVKKISAKVQSENRESAKKQRTEPVQATDRSTLFLDTLHAIQKDHALIELFKRLPSELQSQVELKGSKSVQAEQIRTWLTEIQDDRLSQVVKLNLNGLRLRVIPDEIRYFTGLTELDLSNNEITQIDQILSLKNLTRLNLGNNEISQLPNMVSLSRLVEFSFQKNRIVAVDGLLDQLPPEVRLASILDLQNQNLPTVVLPERIKAYRRNSDLITFFRKLPLDLQGELLVIDTLSLTEKTQLIREWFKGAPEAVLAKVTSLDLSDCNLYMIPEEISRFRNLEDLDLSHNHISALAPISNLPKLQRLIVSYNEISQIPTLNLPCLTVLSVHSNQIRPVEEMLERIPEKARQSFILGVQAQDLPGKITIPGSWRKKTSYSSLPNVLIGLITQGLPNESLHLSRMWNQQTYLTLLTRYKASPLLQRFIDPATLPSDTKAAVLQIQGKVMSLLNESKLEIPFTLEPQLLEQAIQDRSLILLYRFLIGRPIAGTATEQARLIRIWMEENKEELARTDYLSLSRLKLYVIPEEIRYFIGLERLRLEGNNLLDVTPLSSLTNLNDLDLSGNQIVQIETLQGLKKLTQLNLNANQIREIEPLSELGSLVKLSLNENKIDNINPLGALHQLIELNIYSNQIKKVDGLSKLVQIKNLLIFGNRIEDVRPLTSLEHLETLWISSNKIKDVLPLASLRKLKDLQFQCNRIHVQVDPAQFPEAVRDQVIKSFGLQL